MPIEWRKWDCVIGPNVATDVDGSIFRKAENGTNRTTSPKHTSVFARILEKREVNVRAKISFARCSHGMDKFVFFDGLDKSVTCVMPEYRIETNNARGPYPQSIPLNKILPVINHKGRAAMLLQIACNAIHDIPTVWRDFDSIANGELVQPRVSGEGSRNISLLLLEDQAKMVGADGKIHEHHQMLPWSAKSEE